MTPGPQPPIPVLSDQPIGVTSDILKLADSQANLCWAVFAHLIAGFIVFLFPVASLLAGALGILTACIAFTCYRALAGLAWAIILTAFTLVPCLGLFVLVGSSSVATKRLQAAGLRVGFMGVSNSDRNAMREALAHDAIETNPPTDTEIHPDR